jgi:hypothetical protein
MTPIDLVLSMLSGIRVAGSNQWSARCPAHDDHDPSLSVGLGADGQALLNCHAGCTLKMICVAIGIEERDLFVPPNERGQRSSPRTPTRSFSAEAARAVWTRALQRARDDDLVQEDEAVYAYLRGRGLEESWEAAPYGILCEEMALPPEVADWPRCGYRLIAGLHDAHGEVINVQARRILPGDPRTLLPKGSRARGAVFATRSGRELLRSGVIEGGKVLLGEGLTDFLALSIVAPVPVLSAPGASFLASAIGPWVAGQDLYLAADNDAAGEAAIQPTARAAFRGGARNVFAITWPDACKDACDALAALGPVGLAEFLEREILAEGGADAVA